MIKILVSRKKKVETKSYKVRPSYIHTHSTFYVVVEHDSLPSKDAQAQLNGSLLFFSLSDRCFCFLDRKKTKVQKKEREGRETKKERNWKEAWPVSLERPDGPGLKWKARISKMEKI